MSARVFPASQKLLSYVRRAVQDYDMIEDGDKIAVGVSGGKDSMALLCLMKTLSRFYPRSFDISALSLDMGFPGQNLDGVKRLADEIEVELITVKTEIYKIVFETRAEKSPCSLCSNLRRGALHDAAISKGIKKLALGHNREDVLETFFLNLFNEGRIAAFSPVTYLDRKDITVIRPLIYAPEKELTRFAAAENLPLAAKTCPSDGHTQRQVIKNLIESLERQNHGIKKNIFGALERGGVSGFKKPSPQRRKKQNEL